MDILVIFKPVAEIEGSWNYFRSLYHIPNASLRFLTGSQRA